jgi:hypothetical protein
VPEEYSLIVCECGLARPPGASPTHLVPTSSPTSLSLSLSLTHTHTHTHTLSLSLSLSLSLTLSLSFSIYLFLSTDPPMRFLTLVCLCPCVDVTALMAPTVPDCGESTRRPRRRTRRYRSCRKSCASGGGCESSVPWGMYIYLAEARRGWL